MTGLPGQGWLQIGELLLAFAFSALIGFEREIRRKSAGLRTYALVGVASGLFVLVSKYGFNDVLHAGTVVLDPSRIAAQIVSGIGFIGGGVIFMRRDVVRGLTTAASVWLTAAIGMACGAGLIALAAITTAGYFLVMLGCPPLIRRLRHGRQNEGGIRVVYEDGRGLLRAILVLCTSTQFRIEEVRVGDTLAPHRLLDLAGSVGGDETGEGRPLVAVELRLRGHRKLHELIAGIGAIDGVRAIHPLDGEDEFE